MGYEERYIKTRSLPLGHYKRTKAEKAFAEHIRVEYAGARLIDAKWKKYDLLVSKPIAQRIIDALCDFYSVRRVRELRFSSELVGFAAKGIYRGHVREIHLAFSQARLSTVIHELAHHFVSETERQQDMHGPVFCTVLDVLWQTYTELFSRS